MVAALWLETICYIGRIAWSISFEEFSVQTAVVAMTRWIRTRALYLDWRTLAALFKRINYGNSLRRVAVSLSGSAVIGIWVTLWRRNVARLVKDYNNSWRPTPGNWPLIHSSFKVNVRTRPWDSRLLLKCGNCKVWFRGPWISFSRSKPRRFWIGAIVQIGLDISFCMQHSDMLVRRPWACGSYT